MKLNERRNKSYKVERYDYKGLVQFWLHNYTKEQTAGGRLSCVENALYSYDTPIAWLKQRTTGEIVIFLDQQRHSNTTSIHQAVVRNNGVYPVIESAVDGTFRMKSYLQDITYYLDQYSRKRKEHTKKSVAYLINKTLTNLNAVSYYNENPLELTDKQSLIIIKAKFIIGTHQ